MVRINHLSNQDSFNYSYTQAIKKETNNEPLPIIRTAQSIGTNAGTNAAYQRSELEQQAMMQDAEKFEQEHEAFVHPKYDNYTIIKASIDYTDFSEEIGILTNKDGSVTIVRSDENKNKTYINVADKSEAYKLINALEHFDEPDSEKILKKMSKQYNKGEPFYNIGTKGNGESVRNINLIQQ